MRKLTVYTDQKENVAGYIYIIIQVLVLPYILTIFNSLLHTPLSDGELNFIFFSINFVSVIAIFHRYLRASVNLLLQRPFIILRYAFLGFLAYQIAKFLITFIVLRIYPEFTNLNDQSVMHLFAQNYTLMSISVILLAPLAEEVLYRGVLFGSIYKENPILGYVISAIAFCSIHIISYIGLYKPADLLCSFLIYLPAGIFLSWSYEKSGCIIAPILIHIASNQFGIQLLR